MLPRGLKSRQRLPRGLGRRPGLREQPCLGLSLCRCLTWMTAAPPQPGACPPGGDPAHAFTVAGTPRGGEETSARRPEALGRSPGEGDPEWNPGGLYTRPHTPAHAQHSLMQTHVFPPAGSRHHTHPHTSTDTRTGLTTRSTPDPTCALRASRPFCLSPLGTPSSPGCGGGPGSGCQGRRRGALAEGGAGPSGIRTHVSGQLNSGPPLERRAAPCKPNLGPTVHPGILRNA